MERIDPVVQDLQTQCFRVMSAEQKLALVDELIALARELKAASLRSQHPEFPEEEIQARVTRLLLDVAR